MATLEELKQAYRDAKGYVPARIESWTGAVTTQDISNVEAMGSGGTSTPVSATTTTSPTPAPTTSSPLTTTGSLPTPVSGEVTEREGPGDFTPSGPVEGAPAPGEFASSWVLGPDGQLRYWSETEGQWVYANDALGEMGTSSGAAGVADMSVPLWVKGKSGLEEAWVEAWIETGDVMLAREAVRAHSAYDTYYPGNKRDDGTVRVTEEQHLSLVEGYQDALISVGLNPGIFADNFGQLISNNVDVEEFVDRIEAVRAGIIDRAPSVAEYYSENYGIEMTPEAVYASLLDPTVAEGIINRTIAISQIGAAASEHGFGIGLLAAEALVNRDIDIFTARRFFGEAESMVPALGVLAARHNDPDDDFDLGEFTQAEIMNDPEQRRRIRRLLAQERSTFTLGSGQAATFTQDIAGQRAGLAER